MAQVWGTSSPSMATFYGGVLNSQWFNWLSEYNTSIKDQAGQQGTNQLIGTGSFPEASAHRSVVHERRERD